MRKNLSANDADALDKNFDVFDPTDALDRMLLNILGLCGYEPSVLIDVVRSTYDCFYDKQFINKCT